MAVTPSSKSSPAASHALIERSGEGFVALVLPCEAPKFGMHRRARFAEWGSALCRAAAKEATPDALARVAEVHSSDPKATAALLESQAFLRAALSLLELCVSLEFDRTPARATARDTEASQRSKPSRAV